MNIEPLILKERLKLLIGNSKVKAALFYTFNFDPKFFENYIMPLLVPEQPFINNNIANNIIWRKLYKDSKVPTITVYYDQNAKSLDNAPMLDYKLVAVSMPSVGKNKGNFHPKHSFILTENENDTSLIVITGSNNITQGGWCENTECISEHVLVNKVFYPYALVIPFKKFIRNINYYFANNYLTEAEIYILDSLNKKGLTNESRYVLYDSYQGSFLQFLEGNVFIDPTVNEVEIISPYFKPDTSLIAHFQKHGLTIKIEMPISGDYCVIKEDVYVTYSSAGVKWYLPADSLRNGHSKVYRFYGLNKNLSNCTSP